MRLHLPYRWYPLGAERLYYSPPPVGALTAIGHAVWRVVDVQPVPSEKWTDEEREAIEKISHKYRPHMVVVRPVEITGDDPRARDHDVHLHAAGATWHVYPDEHYPVCAACGEPLPCREQMAARIAEQSAKYMDRYATEGVCPACQEPVTSRQKSMTFSENLEVPAGPPVTFHVGRGGCRQSAADYEKRWVAADPNRRRAVLSCAGHVTTHNDGTYECTEFNECPGPRAKHTSFSVCRCPDCHARGPFDCHPPANARLLRRDVA